MQNLILAAMPRCDLPKWYDSIVKVTEEYNLSGARLAMFLAQVGHESSDLNVLEESLNYSVEGLLRTFGRHRITTAQANLYGRKAGQSANQEMLANTLYGGSWGANNLGNVQVGDGWKYRGQGAIQLTGRSNFKACGDAIGVDLIESPWLLTRDKIVTLQAACWYFTTRTSGTDIVQVTKQINGGTHGLDDRKKRYEDALKFI